MDDGKSIAIGVYCEAPDGRIARTFGWSGATRLISYLFDDDGGSHTVHADEFHRSWKLRPDLKDFPNARDPVLPYTFDLFWDAKRRSQLIGLLADGTDEEDVRQAMREHGIVLTEQELEAVKDLKEVRGLGGSF